MAQKIISVSILLILILGSCTSVQKPEKFVTGEGCYTGAFIPGISAAEYERITGKKIAIYMWFAGIQMNRESFPLYNCIAHWELGHVSNITIEPHNQKLQEIIDGKYDEFYRKWAVGAKSFAHPLMIRWAHEMNGNWYVWSGIKNGGNQTDGYGDPLIPDGPERYRDAYRHIYTIFSEEGAENVIWIWCPNAGTPIDEPWNDVKHYYPGDEFVDWIGMDGYNWGDKNKQLGWQSFSEIYKELYSEIEEINKDKPIIIGEFASAEAGGDKGKWIEDAFYQIKNNFTRIRAFVWFHVYKEAAWLVNSSEASEKAFQKSMSDPYFKGSIFD